MMKKWIRTTHNFNNENRSWEFREELRDIKPDFPNKELAFVMHLLEPDIWESILTIRFKVQKYIYQNPNDFGDRYQCDGPHDFSLVKFRMSDTEFDDEILKNLEIWETAGCVKSKEE